MLRTGRVGQPVRFPGILRYCPADNFKSDGQPSLTSVTNFGRVRNATEFLFFGDRGGQHTSQKNKNHGISDFSQSHVCFGLAGFQNLLFLFKVSLQDFLYFWLVECQQWNNTSRWCLWKGCIKRSYPDVQSSLKVHVHSKPSNSFPDHWFGFSVFQCLSFHLRVSQSFFSFWGSGYFPNSVTSNQRARTGTRDYFPH